MNDLKLDEETWDLIIENFDLVGIDGVDAIKQNLRQRLQTFLGEWFLDQRIGLPYFQEIFKKNFDPIVLDTAFKREIIMTDGIIELLEFSLEIDNASRQLTMNSKQLSTSGVFSYSLTT